MTVTGLHPRIAAPAPSRIGQATAVEQSRAIAQVQAMVVVAQQCPRRVHACIAAMEEACKQIELAEKAFFRFPRGGENVSGESVHLARELARCWGNIEHGVTEMRRDDGAAQSEMQAFAWDLEANTRSASIFIVPHKRDTRQGVKDLVDLRDIYENNANNGARRLREAIFSILPAWFTAQAAAICKQTLADGGGKPIAQRIAEAVKVFERYGVTPARMEAKFGRPAGEWTGHDVALLGTIYESIRQGTVTADQEFPEASPRVTAEEITGAGPPPGEPPAQPKPRTARKTRKPPADSGEQDASLPATPAQDGPPLPGEEEPDPAAPDATQTAHQDSPVPAGDPGEDDGTPGTVTGPQITAIWTVLSQVFKFTRDEKDAARQVCAHIAGRPLGSTKDMSRDDGRAVLDTLANWRELAESSQMTPREALTEIMADAAAAAGSDGSAEAGDG